MALACTMSLSLSGKSSTFFSPLNQRVYWPSSWEFMTKLIGFLLYRNVLFIIWNKQLKERKKSFYSLVCVCVCVLLASIPFPTKYTLGSIVCLIEGRSPSRHEQSLNISFKELHSWDIGTTTQMRRLIKLSGLFSHEP